MKPLTFKSFFFGFLKDWVAPKVGTAYVVWQLFEIIWNQPTDGKPSDGNINQASLDGLVKLVEKVGAPWFTWTLIILGGALIATMILKFIKPRDPSKRWVLKYMPTTAVMAAALNFAFGSLTVPLSVLMFFAAKQGLGDQAWAFAISILIFVIASGGLYWIAEEEKNSGEELAIWQVRLPQSVNGDEVCKVLDAHFKNLQAVIEDARVIYATRHHAVIALMLSTSVRKWSDSQVKEFRDLLKKSSAAVTNKIPGSKIRNKHPSDEIELAFKQRKLK